MLSNKTNDLLTIQEASEALNCHPNTLRQWEKKGLLKPIRIGIRGDRRYRREDLNIFLDKKIEPDLKNVLLPSGYDLTRIDMTGTRYDVNLAEATKDFKGYQGLEKEELKAFDYKKILNQQMARIQYFEKSELAPYPTLARKILHILTSGRYRNGTLETIDLPKCEAEFLKRIQWSIDRSKPISCVLPAFPCKTANPLKSSRRDGDLAEIGAFCRFNEINLQIKKVYKPGATFTIFHDGHLYYQHFLHEKADADRYFGTLKKFVKSLGLEEVIIFRDAFSELKKIDDFSVIYKKARQEIKNLWDSEGASNEKILRIIEASKNNLNLSHIPYDILYHINFVEDWDLTREEKKIKEEISKRAKNCAFEYMVVQHALEKADFFSRMVPHGIRLSVHPKAGQIGIYLVKRKTELLPWMGVGVLKNDGAISVRYESELLSNPKYRPVFIAGEKFPFYYKEAEALYQGAEEFRGLFDRIAANMTNRDKYWTFAFSTEYLDEGVRGILANFHLELAKKGIEDRAICRKSMLETIKKTYQGNDNIQIEGVEDEIPAGVVILKDRIINLIWGAQPAAFEVRTEEVVKRYTKLFKEQWKDERIA